MHMKCSALFLLDTCSNPVKMPWHIGCSVVCLASNRSMQRIQTSLRAANKVWESVLGTCTKPIGSSLTSYSSWHYAVSPYLLYNWLFATSDWYWNDHVLVFLHTKFKQVVAGPWAYVIISHKKQLQLPPNDLRVNGLSLERVHEYKYLGVWLTSGLTWSKHINTICNKA